MRRCASIGRLALTSIHHGFVSCTPCMARASCLVSRLSSYNVLCDTALYGLNGADCFEFQALLGGRSGRLRVIAITRLSSQHGRKVFRLQIKRGTESNPDGISDRRCRSPILLASQDPRAAPTPLDAMQHWYRKAHDPPHVDICVSLYCTPARVPPARVSPLRGWMYAAPTLRPRPPTSRGAGAEVDAV
ncbi:hypothetical protein B0H12DRAFT_711322 [Mycena haematopus]|nr:hypothetical protein B0H12DRAFT_711322 [Mycena haematopus]